MSSKSTVAAAITSEFISVFPFCPKPNCERRPLPTLTGRDRHNGTLIATLSTWLVTEKELHLVFFYRVQYPLSNVAMYYDRPHDCTNNLDLDNNWGEFAETKLFESILHFPSFFPVLRILLVHVVWQIPLKSFKQPPSAINNHT